MEEIKQVQTFQVNYKCDKCDDGYLIATGTAFTTNITVYDHICSNPKCQNSVALTLKYPYIKYKPKPSKYE